MVKFSEFEHHIRKILSIHRGESIQINGDYVTIDTVGKPTVSLGEPVTDIYVGCSDKKDKFNELKISVKQDNADFIVNKMNAEVAQNLFGNNWSSIIADGTQNIRDRFENRPLIYKNKWNRTESGSITLGWKYEILMGNKSGELSNIINMDISSILRGDHISEDKRNAKVNGNEIKNSGTANTIITGTIEDYNNIDDVMNNLMNIDDYVQSNKLSICFACKAINYRSLFRPEPKWDGNRPLAVYVNWSVESNRLCGQLVFHEPLQVKANEVADKLSNSLTEINAKTTNDLNQNNTSPNIKIHL